MYIILKKPEMSSSHKWVITNTYRFGHGGKVVVRLKHMRCQVERRLEECSRLQTYQAQSWTPLGRMLSPTNIWGAKLNAAWKNALAYKHMRRQVERRMEECSRLQTYEAPSWTPLGRMLSPTNIWGAKLNAAWKNALAYKHMRRQVERRLEECSRLQTYEAPSWTPLGRMLSPTNICGAKLNAAWKSALAYKHMRCQVERRMEECSRLQTYEVPSWTPLGRMLSPTNIWGAKLNTAWKNALAQGLSQACVIALWQRLFAKWERHFQFSNNTIFDVK